MSEENETDAASSPAPAEESTPKKKKTALGKVIDFALWGAALFIVASVLWPKKSGPELGIQSTPFNLPVVGETGRFVHDGKRDRPLLVETFASWCTACRRSSDALDTLVEAAEGGGLEVIAVSVDDEVTAALTAKREWPIRAPVLHDEQGEFQRAYGVKVLPTFVLIDTDGKVIDVSSGPAGPNDLRRWLQLAR